MKFSGLDDLGSATTKQNEDNSFTLSIDQDMLTKENDGKHVLKVEYKDDQSDEYQSKTIVINI